MINVTIANPYYNPHLGRPYNEPVIGGYEPPEHPLIGVERMIRLTGEMQRAFPQMALVATGYSWLRHLMPYVGAAVLKKGMAGIIGAGRLSLAYPDYAGDILFKGKLDPDKVCIACSACTQIMRDGGTTGCVVRDNKVYGPIYKKGRSSVSK
jgi:2,4-dienoyl-CoA reductase-like NADH-dependent reductase (Old Yellow Enzyme family)